MWKSLSDLRFTPIQHQWWKKKNELKVRQVRRNISGQPRRCSQEDLPQLGSKILWKPFLEDRSLSQRHFKQSHRSVKFGCPHTSGFILCVHMNTYTHYFWAQCWLLNTFVIYPEGFASCRSCECSTWTGREERGVSWALLSSSIGRYAIGAFKIAFQVLRRRGFWLLEASWMLSVTGFVDATSSRIIFHFHAVQNL